jgi:hypothetical protein
MKDEYIHNYLSIYKFLIKVYLIIQLIKDKHDIKEKLQDEFSIIVTLILCFLED